MLSLLKSYPLFLFFFFIVYVQTVYLCAYEKGLITIRWIALTAALCLAAMILIHQFFNWIPLVIIKIGLVAVLILYFIHLYSVKRQKKSH